MHLKKKLFLIIFFCFFLSNIFSVEFQVNGTLGVYSKDSNLYKDLYGSKGKIVGLGFELFFLKFSGFYVDANYMFASGKSTFYKKPINYNEIHLSGGLKFRFSLIRLSPFNGINIFIKGGGVFLRYSENFESTISGNYYGFSLGSGANLWLKNLGIGVEIVKNFFLEKEFIIEGLDMVEMINFGGMRISLKVSLRL